ncbi:hypothetical protein CAEBREN_22437 [Caenorhabditis brenneri]|uniref:Uncharacterized protein n=1 Tax=Caenorhabditis brenneri TaxID=135651 RepID=G0PKM8_CAEBE|nr:hypothetical protein CAEBREN_22437 [Caenorhabditis brenneri]
MPPLQRMLQLLQQQQMMIHQEMEEQQMLKQQNRHRLEQTRQHQQQQQQRILGLGRGCAARDARGGRESNPPPNRSCSRSPQGALQSLPRLDAAGEDDASARAASPGTSPASTSTSLSRSTPNSMEESGVLRRIFQCQWNMM